MRERESTCNAGPTSRIIPSPADKHMLEDTIFVQDCASPHIATRVKNLLCTSFGEDRVLSCNFHHAWPSMSPDLNTNDYWQSNGHGINVSVESNIPILISLQIRHEEGVVHIKSIQAQNPYVGEDMEF
ncbi:uncharacterized protein TNCV_3727991 [Trichonephila clavipes]|uniref:Uncharacterized protein n=1 Tax=Trichonephila clavipes TaxID=2585209 RepID=A0A8X6R2V9_TRICX|nr:uncharacterized protein TNCV_3727991 [Trichonephila clavipes]